LDVPTVLESFSLETFAEHVGDTFQVEVTGGEAITMVLARAQSLGGEASGHAGRRQPFSLEFSGPATLVFPQAIYRFSHATIGTFEMFIVPIGPVDGAMRYEAIFT
jgi:hypothetical protein